MIFLYSHIYFNSKSTTFHGFRFVSDPKYNYKGTYTQISEETRNVMKDAEEHAPLIPKPEMALVKPMNEMKVTNGVIGQTNDESDPPTPNFSNAKSRTVSATSKSTAISSSTSMDSHPLLSLKSVYSDAILFYQSQSQKEDFDSTKNGK